MGKFLVWILADLITGASKRRLAVAEALEAPPVNRVARRYRIAALGLFMSFSFLLLIAALVDVIAGAHSLSEVFWGRRVKLGVKGSNLVFCF